MKNILTLIKLVIVSSFVILTFQMILTAQNLELIKVGTSETLRSILVIDRNDDKTQIFIGTSKGNIFYRKPDLNRPDFSLNSDLSKTSKVIRDIQVSDNRIYALKQDGLYSYDITNDRWDLRGSVDDIQEETPTTDDSEAELRGMAFAGRNRLCIVGGTYKNDFLSREILKCTDSLNPPFWKGVVERNKRKYPDLQLSSIFFDSNDKNGWAVGTANEEGIIWSTTDGGISWSEDENTMSSTLFSLGGNEKRIYAVGTNGLIVYKTLGSDKVSRTKPPSEENLDTVKELSVNSKVVIDVKKFMSGVNFLPQITGTIEKIETTEDGQKLYKIKITNPQLKEVVKNVNLDALLESVYLDRSLIIESKKDVSPAVVRVNMNLGWTRLEETTIKRGRFKNEQLNSIKFDRTGRHGFIVGKAGVILRSSDYGDTWQWFDNNLRDIDLFAISYSNNSAWIVGSNGTLVKIKL